MAHLFIFGPGYCGERIARAMVMHGWRVTGTTRTPGRSAETEARRTGSPLSRVAFADEDAVRRALGAATHVLSSVPPENAADGAGDPVLARYGDALGHGWLGYLSSTGVYGDTGGAWVDESASTVLEAAGTGRRTARAAADAAWLARGARVFRLPGIYGPGRSALERVREGRARRIDLPGQVFSRVHVDDIAAGVSAALSAGSDALPGTYNLADDLPTSQNAVIEEACRLLGREPPPLQSLDEAGLSPMARAFYDENRRIANGKARRTLGWRPRHADYRDGLRACLT